MSDLYLNEEQMEKIDALREARVARKAWEERESELRADILQMLGGEEQALTGSGSVAVKVTTQVRRNVDRAKLEALYPEVFETVVSESTVTVVKLP